MNRNHKPISVLLTLLCFSYLCPIIVYAQTKAYEKYIEAIDAEQQIHDRQISTNTQHLQDLDKRVNDLDSIPVRLAKLEVTVDGTHQIVVGLLVGAIMQFITLLTMLVYWAITKDKTCRAPGTEMG